jgi:hypothetical protein
VLVAEPPLGDGAQRQFLIEDQHTEHGPAPLRRRFCF